MKDGWTKGGEGGDGGAGGVRGRRRKQWCVRLDCVDTEGLRNVLFLSFNSFVAPFSVFLFLLANFSCIHFLLLPFRFGFYFPVRPGRGVIYADACVEHLSDNEPCRRQEAVQMVQIRTRREKWVYLFYSWLLRVYIWSKANRRSSLLGAGPVLGRCWAVLGFAFFPLVCLRFYCLILFRSIFHRWCWVILIFFIFSVGALSDICFDILNFWSSDS